MALRVAVAYVDFSPAFCSVTHAKLFHNLNSYGISGELLDFISYFLSDHSHCTKVIAIHDMILACTQTQTHTHTYHKLLKESNVKLNGQSNSWAYNGISVRWLASMCFEVNLQANRQMTVTLFHQCS